MTDWLANIDQDPTALDRFTKFIRDDWVSSLTDTIEVWKLDGVTRIVGVYQGKPCMSVDLHEAYMLAGGWVANIKNN